MKTSFCRVCFTTSRSTVLSFRLSSSERRTFYIPISCVHPFIDTTFGLTSEHATPSLDQWGLFKEWPTAVDPSLGAVSKNTVPFSNSQALLSRSVMVPPCWIQECVCPHHTWQITSRNVGGLAFQTFLSAVGALEPRLFSSTATWRTSRAVMMSVMPPRGFVLPHWRNSENKTENLKEEPGICWAVSNCVVWSHLLESSPTLDYVSNSLL